MPLRASLLFNTTHNISPLWAVVWQTAGVIFPPILAPALAFLIAIKAFTRTAIS